jgi:phosphate uptake regulator
METRKIYMTGGSTYVISLPKKWVLDSGLKEGDSVIVTEQEGSVVIEPGEVERGHSKAELKASELSSSEALERLIIAYYLGGYDAIKIKFDKEDLNYKEGIRKVLNLLVGVEVVEDLGDSITLEILLDHQRLPTAQVLRRIYMIGKSMLLDVLKAFEEKNINLVQDVISREKDVDRLYFLAVRQLKSAVRYQQVAEKLGIRYARDALGFRIVVKSFERIADHIKNIAESYIQLVKLENFDFSEIIKLGNKVLVVYEKAARAIFAKEANVDEIFSKVKEVEKLHLEISNTLFGQKSVQSSLFKKTIIDSMNRIASYSADITEIAINMSVKVPSR